MNFCDEMYRQEDANTAMRPVGFEDFINLQIPEREWLLSPILPMRSLSMIYASRGIGKSFLSLSICLAVAGGCPLLRWSAPKPRRVLLCDGEMVLSSLQDRLKTIAAGLGANIPNDGFRILAADACPNGINIGTEDGQSALAPLLNGVDLVVLDNISTLTNGSESSWSQMQSWLLKLRKKTSVLLIHHSGKSGLTQRGSSKREDALDCVIALQKPAGYQSSDGCRFNLSYEKLRHKAENVAPFEARLNDEGMWTHGEIVASPPKTPQPKKLEDVSDLLRQGFSIRQISERLGLPKSSVWRIRSQAINNEGANGQAH